MNRPFPAQVYVALDHEDAVEVRVVQDEVLGPRAVGAGELGAPAVSKCLDAFALFGDAAGAVHVDVGRGSFVSLDVRDAFPRSADGGPRVFHLAELDADLRKDRAESRCAVELKRPAATVQPRHARALAAAASSLAAAAAERTALALRREGAPSLRRLARLLRCLAARRRRTGWRALVAAANAAHAYRRLVAALERSGGAWPPPPGAISTAPPTEADAERVADALEKKTEAALPRALLEAALVDAECEAPVLLAVASRRACRRAAGDGITKKETGATSCVTVTLLCFGRAAPAKAHCEVTVGGATPRSSRPAVDNVLLDSFEFEEVDASQPLEVAVYDDSYAKSIGPMLVGRATVACADGIQEVTAASSSPLATPVPVRLAIAVRDHHDVGPGGPPSRRLAEAAGESFSTRDHRFHDERKRRDNVDRKLSVLQADAVAARSDRAFRELAVADAVVSLRGAALSCPSATATFENRGDAWSSSDFHAPAAEVAAGRRSAALTGARLTLEREADADDDHFGLTLLSVEGDTKAVAEFQRAAAALAAELAPGLRDLPTLARLLAH